MMKTKILLENQQLDELGGEPLEGSGFEDETPDAVTNICPDAATSKERADVN